MNATVVTRAGLIVLLAAASVFAAGNTPNALKVPADVVTVPHLISYQGSLTDGAGNPINGTRDLTFRFYDGMSQFWTETQTGVVITKGIFNVLLGAGTRIPSMPDAGVCSLEVLVGGVAISPKTPLVSAAYAFKADTANYALAAPTGPLLLSISPDADSFICVYNSWRVDSTGVMVDWDQVLQGCTECRLTGLAYQQYSHFPGYLRLYVGGQAVPGTQVQPHYSSTPAYWAFDSGWQPFTKPSGLTHVGYGVSGAGGSVVQHYTKAVTAMFR